MLLGKAGIESRVDPEHGIDHGGWTPLIIAAPNADIPVVQLSLVRGLDAKTHIEIGRALRPLRDQGVLIFGSGGAVHNLRALDWSTVDNPGKAANAPAWAAEFQNWLDETLAKPGRSQALVDWQQAPHARMAHPREEHLLPLHVASAAAEGEPATKLHQSWEMGSLSLAAYRFG
jgi:aromatic ring-opening dioxygenase catalytic subunit (LigB family)